MSTSRRCTVCRATLDAASRCPGTLPLLDPHRDDRLYGTAHQLVHALGADVTVAMIRNWRTRDGLECQRIGRAVYSPLAQAASIEAAKSRTKRDTGKGRPRRLDVPLVLAA
ncbi:hypothetical protein [Micromonospora rubida]